MTKLLQDAGYKVDVASTTAEPLVASNKTIKPDLKLADVKISDYAGFIVPCLTLTSALPPNLESGIRDGVAQGKPVAGQTGGMIALAKAGVLSGRKIAEIPMPDGQKPVPDDIRAAFKDTVRSRIRIAQDGPVILRVFVR